MADSGGHLSSEGGIALVTGASQSIDKARAVDYNAIVVVVVRPGEGESLAPHEKQELQVRRSPAVGMCLGFAIPGHGGLRTTCG